ncbi:MAG: sugar ABC transporter permease [Ignavibacteriales bacterium]|nr:MAG: sugar ABC transporter permease [Ignavibacteriales bacterium]
MKINRSAEQSIQLKLLLPVLIPVIILSVFPILRGIYLGFTDYRLGSSINFNFLDNYSYMLQDRYFWRSFIVGFIWTFAVTIGQIIFGLGLALLLNEKFKFNSLTRVLILIPWAMPPVIRGIMWRFIYDTDAGVLNYFFISAGIFDTPINWLNSFTYTIPAIIVVGLWGEIPKSAVFLLAGLKTIPKDLYESAKLDGANSWQEFRQITIPMLKPILAAIVSLSFMWNFNTFGLVWVLTQGGPGGMTRLPMLAAYEEAFRYGNVGYAAAIGNVMIIAISIVLYFYLKKQFKERIT